jgi:hypothetical protein
VSQIVQVAGAVAILVPFVLAQFRVLGTQSLLYILLNFVGSAVLASLALQGRQWGFVLLEGTWALVSLWGLITLARPRNREAMEEAE